jgi:catechol 2,3-dioxygenase-like lactoylglutathione lyase family enzyme
MAVQLNHTIVASRDALAGATFLSEVLGLPAPVRFGRFQAVSTGNGVSMDYADVPEGAEIHPQHYAFLVDEDEFDVIFGRIVERRLEFWADPGQTRPGEIGTDHGRGCYFLDPDGHYLEILTKPYEPW